MSGITDAVQSNLDLFVSRKSKAAEAFKEATISFHALDKKRAEIIRSVTQELVDFKAIKPQYQTKAIIDLFRRRSHEALVSVGPLHSPVQQQLTKPPVPGKVHVNCGPFNSPYKKNLTYNRKRHGAVAPFKKVYQVHAFILSRTEKGLFTTHPDICKFLGNAKGSSSAYQYTMELRKCGWVRTSSKANANGPAIYLADFYAV